MWARKLFLLSILPALVVSCAISPQKTISQVLDAASGGQEAVSFELDPSQSSSYELAGGIRITIPEGSLTASDTIRAEVKPGEFSSDYQGGKLFLSDRVLEISLENQDFFQTPLTLEIPYTPEEFPKGSSEEQVAAFYLGDISWIPVPGEVWTEENKITLKTLYPGTWTWGLVGKDQSEREIISWLNSIGGTTEGEQLYKGRLSEWESSWEQLAEQVNTMVELETPLQTDFDNNQIPGKGIGHQQLKPLMDKFGIKTGPAVFFIVGAQEIGVVNAVLGSEYMIDYFGEPGQLNESIKSERRAWMGLKEAECIRDTINNPGNLAAKPYCFEMLANYIRALQNEGRIDDPSLDLEFSAITDTIFDEYFTGYVKDMAEIEELFNVEIVDQEISYDETGEKLELPDVTGMTVENAEKLLRSLGFEVEILEGSSEFGAGIIYRQKPEPGVFSDPLITVVKIYNTVDE